MLSLLHRYWQSKIAHSFLIARSSSLRMALTVFALHFVSECLVWSTTFDSEYQPLQRPFSLFTSSGMKQNISSRFLFNLFFHFNIAFQNCRDFTFHESPSYCGAH